METAAPITGKPEWTSALTARPAPARGSRGTASTRPRHRSLHLPALLLLLAVTLLLRLWGIKQGLPYSYNVDEAEHFVPRAVGFFSQNLNPNYFLNPPAYSYVLHIVFELWFGSADAVNRAYASNPTEVFVVARVVAAVLGTISVLLTYLAAARLFDRAVALLAAAIFGLAFLPIFYSHLALNDVPTLAPVALALYGIAGVLAGPRMRDYLIAGAGVGLAAATKYTGGITLACLIVAWAFDARRSGQLRPALLRLLAALLVCFGAFVLANPYAALDFSAFTSGISSQASLADGQDPVKLGASPGSGILYYVWTFSWGMGMLPSLAAIAGAGLLLARRRLAIVLALVPATVGFVLFMGTQQRFFGRWAMPVFPIVAILGAYAGIELVRSLHRHRRVPPLLGGVAVALLMLTQSVAAVVHNDEVLSRADTRNLTRAWMVAHVPAGSKVVIEPVVPDNWATDIGTALPWTPTGERWYRYATWLTDVDPKFNLLPAGQRRFVAIDQYERTLRPELLSEYVNQGYCWLVIGSLQAGRAFSAPRAAPSAVKYYATLANVARLVYHVSPFAAGSHPVPFSFDWSIDYYPRQYHLPGPEMSVYKLTQGKCGH
jgi:4-amino-4-deoxy-L-arabinose transferase-like glycosyltransferase